MDMQAVTSQMSLNMGVATSQRAVDATQVQTKSLDRARKVGEDFEAMFFGQMMQHMFSGLDESGGYFGGGHAEAMFRPMLLNEYSKLMSKGANGLGIADMVVASLLQTQEQANQGLTPKEQMPKEQTP